VVLQVTFIKSLQHISSMKEVQGLLVAGNYNTSWFTGITLCLYKHRFL